MTGELVDEWIELHVGDMARIFGCVDEELAAILAACATKEHDVEPDQVAQARLKHASTTVAGMLGTAPEHAVRIERLLAAYGYVSIADSE